MLFFHNVAKKPYICTMNESQRTYMAIDLKSFYASVECVERGLNPLTTNLVVADKSRTDKTICLAVTPSLKAHGIGGRPRLFEVAQKVSEVNKLRPLPNNRQPNSSTDALELEQHPDWAIDYLVALPRMALYIEYSTRVHSIYLKYIAPEDIHVYSIDEVLMDVTEYLKLYKLTAHELAMKIIRDVLATTGITATAGIGSNLYLCKVAMDIVAKHIPADKDGVRIAELDEMSYRRLLWDHRPITDFWRVGRGIANRLSPYGIDTMGKIARLSLIDEDLLYKLFGVNAELIIDHAWGWEPCTMSAIKAYRSDTHSLSHGQVLTEPYNADDARIVVEEMARGIALELTAKGLLANKINLYIGYDVESLRQTDAKRKYQGKIKIDHYGRSVPKSDGGTMPLSPPTALAKTIATSTVSLFDKVVNPTLLIRRLTVVAGNVVCQQDHNNNIVQLDLFDDNTDIIQGAEEITHKEEKEDKLQQAMLDIQKQFGKNSILSGISFNKSATARDRNRQIGGHKA